MWGDAKFKLPPNHHVAQPPGKRGKVMQTAVWRRAPASAGSKKAGAALGARKTSAQTSHTSTYIRHCGW